MTTTHYYKSPKVLLNELGITEPQDIRIEGIAQYCGATIMYETLTGCEARILGLGDQAFIRRLSKISVHSAKLSA